MSVGTSTMQIDSTREEATKILSKAMGDLSLRNFEIEKLKATI